MHSVSNSVLCILEALENRKITLNVYLDLSKAFDTINTGVLLKIRIICCEGYPFSVVP